MARRDSEELIGLRKFLSGALVIAGVNDCVTAMTTSMHTFRIYKVDNRPYAYINGDRLSLSSHECSVLLKELQSAPTTTRVQP